jgi:hypothetical protein
MKRLRSRCALAFCALATFVLSACGGGSHASLPPTQPTGSPGAAAPGGPVSSAQATFVFTFPKNTSAAARKPQYLSSATASISLTVTDVKVHGTSTDIFANVPASLKSAQYANFTNTTGNPNTPGQCGTDPSNAGNVQCAVVFQLPIGDVTATISSWSATNGGGSLLSQIITTTPLYVQQGIANNFPISLDAQVGSTGCPSPSIVVTPPGSVAGTQCTTITFSGTTALVFPVVVKDAAGKTIPATGPGAPIITVATSGGIAAVAASSNPSQITVTPTGTAGGGTVTVTASGLHAGDGITQRTTTFNIQEDAQVGSAGCATPSIVVTAPSSGVTGSECSGTSAGTFTLNGTSPLVFTVALKSASGATIAAGSSGAPILSVTSTGGLLTSAVASQNPYSITLTPNGTSGSGTVTVTAGGATAGDGVTARSITFNIGQVPTLVAAGGCTASSCQIALFTMSGVNFTPYGTISGTAIGTYGPAILGFDTSNTLYMYDNNSNVILEYPFSQLQTLHQSNTQPPLPTPISNGINSNTNAGMYSSFDLAPDGTMAVANPIGNVDQLVKFAPGATTYSLGRTFPGPMANYWYRGFAVSLLSDTTGSAFGYAAALLSDNGTATSNFSATSTDGPSKVAILSAPGMFGAGTTTTCDPGTISCEETDLTNNGLSVNEIYVPTMIWDRADQDLIVANNDTGVITQTPYSAGTFGGTTTIGAPLPVPGTLAGSNDILLSVSRDGHLAVAYSDATNWYVTVYDKNRVVVSGWSAKNFGAWTIYSISFLADDSLVIAGGPSPSNYLEHFLLTNTTTTADANVQLTGQTLGLIEVSVSGQSAHRRVLGRRGMLGIPARRL